MVSETVQVSCVTNGEADNIQSHKKRHLGSDETTIACCYDKMGNDEGDLGKSSREVTDNLNCGDMQLDGVRVRRIQGLTPQLSSVIEVWFCAVLFLIPFSMWFICRERQGCQRN